MHDNETGRENVPPTEERIATNQPQPERPVDPQQWADAHATIGGDLRLQDPERSEAWIQSDTPQEVCR